MLALGRLGAKYRGVSKAGLATPLRAALLLPSKGTVNRDRCLSIEAPLCRAARRVLFWFQSGALVRRSRPVPVVPIRSPVAVRLDDREASPDARVTRAATQ